jgi:hypothetical protein
MLPASAAVITMYVQEDGGSIVGLTFGIGSGQSSPVRIVQPAQHHRVTSTILPAPDLVNSNSIAVQTEVGGPHPKTYLSAPMA